MVLVLTKAPITCSYILQLYEHKQVPLPPSLSIIRTSLEKLSLKLCRADQIGYQQLRVHLKLVVQDPIRIEQQSSPRLAVGTVLWLC
jgi:hypothetical protein